MSRCNIKTIIIVVLAALFVAFIWSNSLKSQEESGAQSTSVSNFLRQILDPAGRIPVYKFHHFVRKAAHFVEFAILGGLIGCLFQMIRSRTGRGSYVLPILLVVLVAVLDEYIQTFTGRGNRVSDVLLDCYGGLFGLGMVLLVAFPIKKK